jgi:hypothetical protein
LIMSDRSTDDICPCLSKIMKKVSETQDSRRWSLRFDCAGDQLDWSVSRFVTLYVTFRGPGSVVGIATGYGLRVCGSNPVEGEIFRTCPDLPWGPPSLL